MHPNQHIYNQWSAQYDTNHNRTRDTEARALRSVLSDGQHFAHALEIGCGTGKNSEWLASRSARLTAVDFSEGMLQIAREKVHAPNAAFLQADASQPWTFADAPADLITFSLVLEHLADLHAVFAEAARHAAPGAVLYVGELHPAKQYAGTVARFDGPDGRTEAQCFVHHLTDFVDAAAAAGWKLEKLAEWFDEDDRRAMPRVLTMLFRA